jgi:anaerobic ribonucleoside-triphosphate reductase activating protein
MRIDSYKIVFQEVPNEVSLLFSVTGCPHRCKGCHSSVLWNGSNGELLTADIYQDLLSKYGDYITTVCFFGGEWYPEELKNNLLIARNQGFKTCLYTGADSVSPEIYKLLDYLKTGAWDPVRGGLDSPKTNQKMISINTGECLNKFFQVRERELSC